MKKLILLIVASVFVINLSAQEFEGLEAGDKEISFNGMVILSEGITMGNVFFSFGTYITDKLLVGAAPGLTITNTGLGGTEADLSAQAYCNYNFSNDSPAFPYVKASFYQQSFKSNEYSSFTDYSFLQVGGGYKTFFTDKMSWDTSATYGVSLGSFDFGSGIFMILTGLSIVW